MEKVDTVTISLSKYNALMDFKRNVNKGNVAVLRDSYFSGTYYSFFSKEEFINEVMAVNKGNEKRFDKKERGYLKTIKELKDSLESKDSKKWFKF